MGLRGPLRDPNSRRGQREQERIRKLMVGDTQGAEPATDDRQAPVRLPTAPRGLPARVEKIWNQLVVELAAAKVPILQIDSHAIEMAARSMRAVDLAGDLADKEDLDPTVRVRALTLEIQATKEVGSWLDRICATPATRYRIGVKAAVERKKGELEKLLEQKRDTQR